MSNTIIESAKAIAHSVSELRANVLDPLVNEYQKLTGIKKDSPSLYSASYGQKIVAIASAVTQVGQVIDHLENTQHVDVCKKEIEASLDKLKNDPALVKHEVYQELASGLKAAAFLALKLAAPQLISYALTGTPLLPVAPIVSQAISLVL